MSRRQTDAAAIFAVALVARLTVVLWARGRFPAVEDGHYYDLLARRISEGAGYTWLWPDGAVTAAAHYPVGYPALLAAAYWAFGACQTTAMTVNAVLGAAGAYAMHRLVDRVGVARRWPAAASLAVALHPALVPYTVACMTEGATASLLIIAAACAAWARRSGQLGRAGMRVVATACAGLCMGIAILVRPQSLVLAPVLGFLAYQAETPLRVRLRGALALSAVALACVAPWTVRNCFQMHRCALVSVNEGWNLLIGATTTSGGWQPVSVPIQCATVWDEAAKDGCFERAALDEIAVSPLAWAARAPAKIAMTFDYFGAAPWYLHASNPTVFDSRTQMGLAAVEVMASRTLLLAALVACGRNDGARRTARKWVALGGAAAALTVQGWLGYLAIPACVGLSGWRSVSRGPIVVPFAAAVISTTAAIHAVFFGAGRYGLVVAPFTAGLAFAGACAARGAGADCEALTPLGRSSAIHRREESPSSLEHDAG